MKKLLVLGAVMVFAVMASVSTAQAQLQQGSFLFGPVVGAAVPIGDFGDAANPGVGFGGSGDYMVLDNFAVGGDVVYNLLGVPNEFNEPGVDLDISVFQFGGHAKVFLNPEASTQPFVFGGAGFYKLEVSASAGEISASASDTEFGINGGAGAMFRASDNLNVAVSSVIHNIFSEGESSQYIGVVLAILFSAGGS